MSAAALLDSSLQLMAVASYRPLGLLIYIAAGSDIALKCVSQLLLGLDACINKCKQ